MKNKEVLLTSEDGVYLYYNDEIHIVSEYEYVPCGYDYLGQFRLTEEDFYHEAQIAPEWYVFSTREAADKWLKKLKKKHT